MIGLGYDVQGNLANKNGVLYGFDYGNRMRGGGPETYRYDAYGRRVRSINGTGGILYSLYSLYGQSGQLLWQRDQRTSQRRNYVYLQGSLLAEHRRPIGSTTETIVYQHIDALGSPVVTTSATKVLGPRREYEPYGYQLTPTMTDGPGYTGHVTDAATGLVYMQQRYYAPLIGQRFLSVDPVTAYSPGGAFNQYWYAAANPYKMTDPDGRDPQSMDDPHPPIPPPVGPFPCAKECNSSPQAPPSQTPPPQAPPPATSEGHRVYAVEPGQVRVIGWQNPGNHKSGAGFRVQIAEGNDKIRIYGHMDPSSIAVDINDFVSDRQYIGDYADPTNGHSNGPHVHDQLMDFSSGSRRDVDPGRESPLGGNGGRVTTPFGVRDAMHPNAHQGTDWAY